MCISWFFDTSKYKNFFLGYLVEEMKKFVLHLMVMSHCYSIPSLKSICIDLLEQDCLTKENVIDVLQLARQCNAPQLSLICVRVVVKDFKKIASTEGWKVMKHANPALEQELLGSVVEADSRREERLKRKRYTCNYTRQWRPYFTYAGMGLGQLDLL